MSEFGYNVFTSSFSNASFPQAQVTTRNGIAVVSDTAVRTAGASTTGRTAAKPLQGRINNKATAVTIRRLFIDDGDMMRVIAAIITTKNWRKKKARHKLLSIGLAFLCEMVI